MIKMSKQEFVKHEIISRALEGSLKQKQAAEELGLSVRQVRRLCKKYRLHGIAGLTHKGRGKKSTRKVSEANKQNILDWLKDPLHQGFGPTFTHETLMKENGSSFSREWLRNYMIKEGLWKPNKQKRGVIHATRERRPREGELIQMDGSYEEWFENRGSKCCLLVIIDDATSKLQELRFVNHETTVGYFSLMRQYIQRRGLPGAVYTDRHNIFKVNLGEMRQDSQFGRGMRELGIHLIHARSPQAKGRVERANGTLQDRLIKQMRLEGISTMEEGNVFLEEYRIGHNKRFARQAQEAKNEHRGLKKGLDLDKILCCREIRKVSKSLSVHYENKTYILKQQEGVRKLIGREVEVISKLNGDIEIDYQGEKYSYRIYEEMPLEAMDRKEIVAFLDKKKPLTSVQRHRRKIAVNF